MIEYNPMLCEPRRDPSEGPTDVVELKRNGMRAGVETGEVRLESRPRPGEKAGNDVTAAFPEVAEIFAPMKPGAMLDVELVRTDERGVDVFNRIQSRIHSRGRKAQMLAQTCPATPVLLDILSLNGTDVTGFPIEHRKELLLALGAKYGLEVNPWTVGDAAARFALAKRDGHEGIVVKKAASKYRRGYRGPEWYKCRVRHVGTFLVVGYVADEPGRLSAFAIAEEDGTFRGTVGSGFLNEANRISTFKIMDSMPSGPKLGDDPDVIWKVSGQSIKVEYSEIMNSGKLFHPAIVL